MAAREVCAERSIAMMMALVRIRRTPIRIRAQTHTVAEAMLSRRSAVNVVRPRPASWAMSSIYSAALFSLKVAPQLAPLSRIRL
jgi:hypothetical protein